MNRRLLFIICASIAVGSLLLAYGLQQLWFGAAAALVLGILAGVGWRSEKQAISTWMTSGFWLGIISLAAIGALSDLNTILLVVAIVAGLGAWDLIRFHKSLEPYTLSKKTLPLEKQHLTLLGITLLVGGTLAVAAALVQIQISFALALALGVILILTLGLIIRYFSKLAGLSDQE